MVICLRKAKHLTLLWVPDLVWDINLRIVPNPIVVTLATQRNENVDTMIVIPQAKKSLLINVYILVVNN